jgi:aldehyde:ferredoxin oxidoreductase
LGATPFVKELDIYDEFSAKGDVSRVLLFQNVMAVLESLGLCEYLLLFLNLSDISSLMAPTLGFDLEPQGLLQLGERVFDAERLLNLTWDRNQNLLSVKPSWSPEMKSETLAQYFSLRHWDEKGTPKNKIEL